MVGSSSWRTLLGTILCLLHGLSGQCPLTLPQIFLPCHGLSYPATDFLTLPRIFSPCHGFHGFPCVLRMELRPSCIPGSNCATELHSLPFCGQPNTSRLLNQESKLQPILLDPSLTVSGGFLNLLLSANPCPSQWYYPTREI